MLHAVETYKNPVDDQGRGLLTPASVEIGEPRQAELADGSCRDLTKWTEPLLAVRSPVGHPLAGLGVGRRETNGVDCGGPRRGQSCGRGFAGRAAADRRKSGHHEAER